MENVCVIIKSECASQSSWFKIVQALHARGIFCVEILVKQPSEVPEELLPEFYAEHAAQPFFARLLDSVSGNLVFIAAQTKDLAAARLALGPTDPVQARATMPNSIRAVFATQLPHNAVHLSDSTASAARELALLRHYGMMSNLPTAALDAEEDDDGGVWGGDYLGGDLGGDDESGAGAGGDLGGDFVDVCAGFSGDCSGHYLD